MKAAIGKTLLTVVALPVLAIVSISILSIWQFRRLVASSLWVQHSDEVLSRAREMENFGLLADLYSQYFLLKRDSAFLDSAVHYKVRRDSSLDRLQALTSDNFLQQSRLDTLRQFLGPVSFTPQVRQILARFESEERTLLSLRREKDMDIGREQQILWWVMVGIVLALALILFFREWNARTALGTKLAIQTGQLADSQEKYRTLFYKSPLPKWIYDQETLQILEVNEAAVRHYGYSSQEFLQMTIADIRPPEDRVKLEKNVAQIGSDSESFRESDWRHVKKNGEVIFIEITAHPIEYEGRKARMVVVNDITESRSHELTLRRLNESLEKRASELAASNAELERFAYIASHDLQEPLRMVSSFMQMLKKRYGGQLDERADQYIHYAVDGADRMKALISDLLEYSRVGSAKENFAVVDMAAVLQEVKDIFRDRIQATHAVLEAGVLPEIRGDRGQLAQLLQNLVGNALKYHREERPVVRVQATEEPFYWKFSVEDNGIGIDPSFFDKIFIVFQRLHNKNDYSGTGIGLAICKKIVERHGGRIWVDSQPGKGSTFYFTIHKHT
jgi:PAS domain S-box-containing protein